MRLNRASVIKGEAGYEEYCKARGDNLQVIVMLNGIQQKTVYAADAVDGWVRRAVMLEGGNIAHDGTNILEETVKGNVTIIATERLQ